MVVGQIRGQQMAEMPLAEDDDVVQTLAPDGSDQSFRKRILPGLDGVEITSPMPMLATGAGTRRRRWRRDRGAAIEASCPPETLQ